ncbi:MAG: restriction endonuclease subunit S, partial [Saprospiraceae bacterium]
MKKYPKYKESGVDWLGEIPSEWEPIKLKYLMLIKNGEGLNSDKIKEEGEFEVIGGNGVLGYTDRFNVEGTTIAIGRVGAKCGNVHFIKRKVFVNDNAMIVKTRKKTNAEFLALILDIMNLNNLSTSTAQPLLTSTSIKNQFVTIGNKVEQHAIVRFLDYKTGQIDSFIANRQKQIELLKEQRNSIIDKAILFGLNDKVTFKEYDNIFVKKLPIKWKLSSVRRELMSQNIEQQDGNHGELHPVATDYVDNGIPFVLASDVNNFEVDLLRCKKIPEKIAENLRIGFSKTGDILLTHKGTIGRVGICDTKEYSYIILTPQVTYYRIKRDFIPKFIFYQFQSNVFNEQLKLLSGGGSTRDYVGIVAQRELKLIKPPIDEQIAIVKQIDIETGKLDTLISKYQKQIDLMQEYRTSLISQAVTGKIDVREWQPK